MRLLLLTMIIAFGTDVHAADGFERVFGGPDLDRGVYVSPTRDGGFVVVGVTKNSTAGGEDVYLVKTDSAGELLWSKTYGGTGTDNGWSVRETQTGFVIAGYTKSFGAGGFFDFYLIKTDPDGELEWYKTYGGENDDRCWALALESDGGFVLLGESKSSGAGEEDGFLVRVDSSGTELWSRTYGGEKGDRLFSVARTEDGGYMLAGQTYSEGAGDRDAYIIKTRANGEMEWSKTFGGAESDVGHSVTRTSDGNFMMTGYTTSFATEGDDPYLVKIDAKGDTLWTSVIPMAGRSRTITGDQATDGGFFLTGFTASRVTGTAALLVKTTSEGKLQWQRQILHTTTGQSFGYTIRATADGGCVFTGHTTVNSAGDLDLMLVRVIEESE